MQAYNEGNLVSKSVLTREEKGSELTHAEMDNNISIIGDMCYINDYIESLIVEQSDASTTTILEIKGVFEDLGFVSALMKIKLVSDLETSELSAQISDVRLAYYDASEGDHPLYNSDVYYDSDTGRIILGLHTFGSFKGTITIHKFTESSNTPS